MLFCRVEICLGWFERSWVSRVIKDDGLDLGVLFIVICELWLVCVDVFVVMFVC